MDEELKLKEDGYPVHPTLAYVITGKTNDFGYAEGYTLQPQAKGVELFNSKMTPEEYHARLEEIANKR